MLIHALGNPKNPAILFFHAMGVTGDSSLPAAEYLKDRYYCILPTSTVYCKGQRYAGKSDELDQIMHFLQDRHIEKLALMTASSLGADLAMYFLTHSGVPVDHVFFDGGQFAQIRRPLRSIMTPFLYLAIKSLAWSNGRTLRFILWCSDESIRPYFIAAGRNLTYGNLRRQMDESLEDLPFPSLTRELQTHTFWEFGSAEDHFKYRDNVMKSYPFGNFPVFTGFNHMQYQIRDPKGFAEMLHSVIRTGKLPDLPFIS